MTPRPASFKRMLGRTLRDQPQHREEHRHGHCGARLDQIAAPRLWDDSRPDGKFRKFTELPIGKQPDSGERREDEPAAEPHGRKADQSEEQRGAPDRAEAGLLAITSRMSIMCRAA